MKPHVSIEVGDGLFFSKSLSAILQKLERLSKVLCATYHGDTDKVFFWVLRDFPEHSLVKLIGGFRLLYPVHGFLYNVVEGKGNNNTEDLAGSDGIQGHLQIHQKGISGFRELGKKLVLHDL